MDARNILAFAPLRTKFSKHIYYKKDEQSDSRGTRDGFGIERKADLFSKRRPGVVENQYNYAQEK